MVPRTVVRRGSLFKRAMPPRNHGTTVTYIGNRGSVVPWWHGPFEQRTTAYHGPWYHIVLCNVWYFLGGYLLLRNGIEGDRIGCAFFLLVHPPGAFEGRDRVFSRSLGLNPGTA